MTMPPPSENTLKKPKSWAYIGLPAICALLLQPDHGWSAARRYTYGGIGVTIRDNGLVWRVLPDSPAARVAGLQVGDSLLGVSSNGSLTRIQSTTSLKGQEIEALLRGPVGSEVGLRFRRSGSSNEINGEIVVVKRAEIHAAQDDDGFVTEMALNGSPNRPLEQLPQEGVRELPWALWDRLSNGLSEAEVLGTVGLPLRVEEDTQTGRSHWVYGRSLSILNSYGFIEVTLFLERGRVTGRSLVSITKSTALVTRLLVRRR